MKILQTSNICSFAITLTLVLGTRAVFSPTSKAELKAAVEECLALPQNTGCSKGPHGAIGSWDVTGVTDMSELFFARVIPGAKSFNGHISKWDVSRVTNMQYMFAGAALFNGDISKWDVSRVTNMEYMFTHAKSFNGDLSKWDVSRVIAIDNMFADAKSFNSDLSKWDVSRVTKMEQMFHGTISFSHTLCGAWRTANAKKDYMFTGSSGKMCGQPHLNDADYIDYYNIAPQREKRTTPRSFRTRGALRARPTRARVPLRTRGPLRTRAPLAGHHQNTHGPYDEYKDYYVLQREKRTTPRPRGASFRKRGPFGKRGARRGRGQRSRRGRRRERHKRRVVSSTHPAPTPPWSKSGFHNIYYYFSNPLSHNRVDYEVKPSVSTTASTTVPKDPFVEIDDALVLDDDVDDELQAYLDFVFQMGILILCIGYVVHAVVNLANVRRIKMKKEDAARLNNSVDSNALNEVKHAFLLSRVLNRGDSDTDSLVPVIGKANPGFEIVIKDNGTGEKNYYV